MSILKKSAFNIFLSLLIGFGLTSCSDAQNDGIDIIPSSTRIINFSGYEWVVRTSEEAKQGPGPNLFSDSEDNVWVDSQGKLHLKVVQKDGNWYCSGVTLRRSFGYKKYIIYLASDVTKLDENVVGGFFTYKNDNEEIDIEFSRWSITNNQNTQFAVQPSFLAGNKVRFDMDSNTDLSTHFFNWQPDKIEFGSYKGHTLNPTNENVISTWTYTGKNIPPENDERLKINLWLFRGNSPTDKKPAEMIINRIEVL